MHRQRRAGRKSCATLASVVAQVFRPAVVGVVVVLSLGATAAAQTETIETDPIRCWWRTSVPAVRVGQPFSVVLTCAVVETDAVTVVPNEMELSPNAMQLPPFDVMGGSHAADLRTTDRRFFQYEYRLRVISEDLFGKDAKLPDLKISYKVRSRVNGESLEGRDLTYVLPATAVRVLSLVPADATNIRDASSETFDDVNRRLSRATILRAVGGVLIGFAALSALVALVRLVGSRKGAPVKRSPVSDGAILRQVGRELTAIQDARQDGSWTAELRGRLLTALRILSAYALEVAAAPIAGSSQFAGNGHLAVRGRGLRGGDVAVAGWVTPVVIDQELARPERSADAEPRRDMLVQLETALGRLTTAQYGRPNETGDEVFDEALATAFGASRRLQIENLWIVRKVRGLRTSMAGMGKRAWSR